MIVAQVIEELIFRALPLVGIFTLVRRFVRDDRAGIVLGTVVAVATSTALFVAAHYLSGDPSADATVSLTLVGLVCGLLVVFAGRIWPAILVHVVFNGTGVLLTVAGTLLGKAVCTSTSDNAQARRRRDGHRRSLLA